MPNNPPRSARGLTQAFETKVDRALQGRGFSRHGDPRRGDPRHGEPRYSGPTPSVRRHGIPEFSAPWERRSYRSSTDQQLAGINHAVERLSRRAYKSADQIEKLLSIHERRFSAALNDVTDAAAQIKGLRDEIEACRRKVADVMREYDVSGREYDEPFYQDSALGSSDLLQRGPAYEESVISEAVLPEETRESESQAERKRKKGPRSNPESEQS